MRSPHSGLLAGVLGWGCLYRADMVILLGAFGVGTRVAGLALGGGCTACAGGVCVRGDWFPPVKSLADMFLVFTHCLSGFWLVGIGFSMRLRFAVWVVWLFRGWPGLSGGDLGCLLGSLCLVLCWRLHAGGHFLVHVAADTFSCNRFSH